jgi:hypothetical protein
MAGTIIADRLEAASTSQLVIENGVALTPPTIIDVNGTEVGTFCRAWVNFNGTFAGNMTIANGGIRGAFNVSSITDSGVGNYNVNFTTPLVDANYSAVFNAGTTGTAGSTFIAPYNFTNTSSVCGIVCFNSTLSAVQDTNTVICAVFR